MASKMQHLNYMFLFPQGSTTWTSLGEFENDLQDFFLANGLSIDVIVPVSGSGVTGVMMIGKAEEDNMYLTNKKGPQIPSNPSGGKSTKSSKMVSGLTRQLQNTTTGGRRV